jgi:hypothetical protein
LAKPTAPSVGWVLTTLGQDVEAAVKPARRRGAGHMSVIVQRG